ncbi:MAG: hypothetical protein HY040_26660 [Planctomycetes bacterium]|nr:hypothetical protein [Planctomycetota bacterium]
MTETIEVLQVLEHLQSVFGDLAVRGLRSAASSQIATLRNLRSELERVGAGHLAGHVAALLTALENDDRSAAATLLRAQANVRVFERILTLEAAAATLGSLVEPDREEEDS